MSLDQRVDSPAGGEAELPEWLEEVSAGARGEEAGQVKQRFSTFGVPRILLLVGLLVRHRLCASTSEPLDADRRPRATFR